MVVLQILVYLFSFYHKIWRLKACLYPLSLNPIYWSGEIICYGILVAMFLYKFFPQPCKVEVDESLGSIKDDKEESVMSMKDFVSYMSALEETECDETSQNISELPLDNEEFLPFDSEESSTPIVVNSRKVEEESVSEDTPVVNSIQGSNDRPKARKSSLSLSNSFGWHEVIHEEDEADEDKENFGSLSNLNINLSSYSFIDLF